VAVTCYRSSCLRSNLHKSSASLKCPVFSTACQVCEIVLSETDWQRQAGQPVSRNIEFTIWSYHTNVNNRTLSLCAACSGTACTAGRLTRPAGSTNRGKCLRWHLALRKVTSQYKEQLCSRLTLWCDSLLFDLKLLTFRRIVAPLSSGSSWASH